MNLILGTIIVFACVLGGYAMEDGHILALYQPAELIIIGGAGLGALVIANSGRTLKKCLHGVQALFKDPKYEQSLYLELMGLMYTLLVKIRKEGLMSLEADVDDPQQSAIFRKFPRMLADARAMEFICDYFRLMVSGIVNTFEIENLIDVDLETAAHVAKKPSEAMLFVSESLPAFGIVAAVMGVVVTMGAIGGPLAELGHKVAAALVGTFLGILLSYGVLGPAARMLQNIAEEEEQFFQCIKSCIIAHLNGYPAKVVIEFARVSIAPDIRPTALEVEALLRQIKG